MNRSRRLGLLAAVTLIGLFAGRAGATGIEKPPGVPPEVDEARKSCPTITGSCFGYFPTRWRVLSNCAPDAHVPEATPPVRTLPAGAAYGPRTSGSNDKAAAAPKAANDCPPVVLHARPMPQSAADRGATPRVSPANEVRPIRAWVAGDDK